MEAILTEFNSTMTQLVNNVASICDASIIAKYRPEILSNLAAYPDKMMVQFVIHVLPDKDKIDSGNDDFFMKKRYDGSDAVDGSKQSMLRALEFKDVWKSLVPENRTMIIDFMRVLCYYSEQYKLLYLKLNSEK
jgi:hypothetical protein